MSSSELSLFLAGIQEANERKADTALSDSLVKELSIKGYSSSHQAPTWRIIDRPSCPLRVQLELRDVKDGIVDIIPLSAYTDSIEECYPLASLDLPHATSLPFRNIEDIEAIVAQIDKCFPKR